jgi:hypothetical protein
MTGFSFAFAPLAQFSSITGSQLPVPIGRGRVATGATYYYELPKFKSQRLGLLHKDFLFPIYEQFDAPDGPTYNPRWYRLAQGFIHSGRIQRVDRASPVSPPLTNVPEGGRLGQVNVPYTQSYRWIRASGWHRLFRLYYGSVHWITAIDAGPGPGPWYRLTDDLLHAHHFVPAAHVRPISPGELSPISPDVPADDKHIEISLEAQTLTAYEGDRPVLQTKISSGIPSDGPSPNGIPTDTPPGRYRIQNKMPSRHMGDGELNPDPEAYELPGVPWVSIFQKDGIALHGTYWHDNFGRRMSHGCVNLSNQDALWLYRWTTPAAGPQDWYQQGRGGTLIDVK